MARSNIVLPTIADRVRQIRQRIACWMPMAIALTIAAPSLARETCPAQVEPLVEQMLPDLPGYANRAIARSRQRGNSDPSSSIIVAGVPEFTPLPLGTARSTGVGEPADDNVRQVFLTTLERVYTPNETIDLQGYHWLFLTATENGWQLVVMYSTRNSHPPSDAPTPPIDATEGAIANGVRTWLRDCHARDMEWGERG
ncbi:MAG: hypothetical protein SWY16_11960 [Cyanobacteriota bacterium]|nr:hypothetical protein [Cyanobacteriota bacterium]